MMRPVIAVCTAAMVYTHRFEYRFAGETHEVVGILVEPVDKENLIEVGDHFDMIVTDHWLTITVRDKRIRMIRDHGKRLRPGDGVGK